MFLVFLQALRAYQDIVYIADAELVEVFAEGVVDKSLARSRCISKTKWHDEKLEEAITSSEGSFPFIAFFDLDLIEAST